jgi:hypothetical protein
VHVLSTEFGLLPAALKRYGYTTVMAGKWCVRTAELEGTRCCIVAGHAHNSRVGTMPCARGCLCSRVLAWALVRRCAWLDLRGDLLVSGLTCSRVCAMYTRRFQAFGLRHARTPAREPRLRSLPRLPHRCGGLLYQGQVARRSVQDPRLVECLRSGNSRPPRHNRRQVLNVYPTAAARTSDTSHSHVASHILPKPSPRSGSNPLDERWWC